MSRDLQLLVSLFHRSYAVPVIALLAEQRGAKFVTLVTGLGASRDTVSATLKSLMELGLVKKNPGYGHPLRPEYVLTTAGERIGADCQRLLGTIKKLAVTKVAFLKWPMPVIHLLGDGASRFGELESALPGITPRALTNALRQLDANQLIARSITESWPPYTEYHPTKNALLLKQDLNQLRNSLAA